MMSTVNPTTTTMNSLTTLQEKDSLQWEDELIDNLWSIEGLQKATITTATRLFSPYSMMNSIGGSSSGGGITVYNTIHIPSSQSIQGFKPQLLRSLTTQHSTFIIATSTPNIIDWFSTVYQWPSTVQIPIHPKMKFISSLFIFFGALQVTAIARDLKVNHWWQYLPRAWLNFSRSLSFMTSF